MCCLAKYKPYKDRLFIVYGTVGRIDVLGLLRFALQGPSAKTYNAAAYGMYGKEYPIPEPIQKSFRFVCLFGVMQGQSRSC